MQLTKFDRWIRKTFVDKTEVLILRKPDFRLPLSSKLKKIPNPSNQYKFVLSFSNEEQAQKIIQRLKSANMSYAVKVREKSNFFSAYMKGNKRSCTYGCLWMCIFAIIIVSLIYAIYLFSDHPIIERLLKEFKFFFG